jgi:hypothetical protein
LIQLRKRVAETVAEVSRSPILLLKHGVFDYRSPNRTVFLIASLESAVFLFSEGTTLLATCLLKDGTSIWEGRADFTGEMGLGIWIVFLVRVWEVSAKSGGGRVLIDEWTEIKENEPVLEVNRRAIVELELRIFQYSLPVADTPLRERD